MPQAELKAEGWQLADATSLRLLEKLRQAGTPLGEYVNNRFYRGIVTGFNQAFVVDKATRDRLIAEHPSSGEVLKPFLRGRDVKRWRVDYQDLWLILTRRGTDIKNYPAIHDYLMLFKDRLTPGIPGGRKPGSYEWYEIQDNIAYWEEFERSKIFIPAIAQSADYAADYSGYYGNDKTNICVTDEVEFVLLHTETLPTLKDIQGDKLTALRAIFQRLYATDHPLRRNLFLLDTLPAIRIIEGKEV